MNIEYFPETDSLYIDLAGRPGTDAVEIADGVVLDIDDAGRPVGIDFDQASKRLDLDSLSLKRIPFGVHQVAG